MVFRFPNQKLLLMGSWWRGEISLEAVFESRILTDFRCPRGVEAGAGGVGSGAAVAGRAGRAGGLLLVESRPPRGLSAEKKEGKRFILGNGL